MNSLNIVAKWAVSAALSLALAPAVQAEDKKPDNEVSFNVAAASEYRYRGISQTRGKPALQGGADYTNNPSGFYLGTWLSSIKWIKDAGGDSNVEWDIYGGKRGEIVKDVSYDVGVLRYAYSGNNLNPDANTTEWYGQIGLGPAYAKYSRSSTNLFGAPDSKGSAYIDVGANLDVSEGWQANLHVGRQNVKHNGGLSYTDYKVGVTRDFGVFTLQGAVIAADTKAYVGPAKTNLGKTSLILVMTKTF